MKRNSKHEEFLVPPRAEPDMAVLMAKIQQQLVILEKKVDSLISQPQEGGFRSERNYKPFQRFDRFSRHDKRDQGNSYRERRFNKAICADCHKECEVPFKPTGDRPVYCQDCFSKRKQVGSFKGGYDKGPDTEKKQSRKSQGRGGKKPVSRRRKERA